MAAKKSTTKKTVKKATPVKAAAKKTAAKKSIKKSAVKAPRKRKKVLKGISDIRRYFYRNEEPVYFISATNFNLINLDEWVGNFRFINYIDCFDGAHPTAMIPREIPHDVFESIEDINNYLLGHKDVVDYIKGRKVGKNAGKAMFLMFDEKTEELAKEIGLKVCFPPAKIRQYVDDKIVTTRIAEEAGVKCVPNVLCNIKDYTDLRKKTKKLGNDLVIQTAYGDSGHTTFFVSSKKDWTKCEEEVCKEKEVKIMKKIRCRGSAQEACVTRHGTIVGPLMTELVGFDELTPYKGGWCGNEVFPDAFSRKVRNEARKNTFKFGEALRKQGYRGYFEVDYLTDLDTEKVYLGEVNPRITGASSMTNLASFAHADAPLILFHLLEFTDEVDFEIDVDELNSRWADPENIDTWSQLVMKHTYDTLDIFTDAPRTGVWRMNEDGTVEFARQQVHRRTVERENEAFFLRISKPGDFRYEGADLGILITPGRLMTNNNQLTKRAKDWINGFKLYFKTRPCADSDFHPKPPEAEIGGFKLL